MNEEVLDLMCSPVDSSLCGDQGAIVTAAAYLDAHYQLDPFACNEQVSVPWVWLVRFATELTYQAAAKAVLMCEGKEYKPKSSHKFADLHSDWCESLQLNQTKNSFQNKCKEIRKYIDPIDNEDPNGLMLRYPLGHPTRDDVPPIPENFREHCEWPIKLRSTIALICDITINRLSDKSQACCNALRYLRCVAGAGLCLGGYSPDSIGTIDEGHDMYRLLERDISHFDTPIDFVPVESLIILPEDYG